jgi:hypothetical protein
MFAAAVCGGGSTRRNGGYRDSQRLEIMGQRASQQLQLVRAAKSPCLLTDGFLPDLTIRTYCRPPLEGKAYACPAGDHRDCVRTLMSCGEGPQGPMGYEGPPGPSRPPGGIRIVRANCDETICAVLRGPHRNLPHSSAGQ